MYKIDTYTDILLTEKSVCSRDTCDSITHQCHDFITCSARRCLLERKN